MSEERSFAPDGALAVDERIIFDKTRGAAAPFIGIRLAPATAANDEFLCRVFASTRAAEMAMTGWSKEQQEVFLRMQYDAQRRSYAMQMPGAEYFVVWRHGAGVGRLILNRLADEIHVADIAVLPQFQRSGIASALMRDIFDEAAQTGKKVSLQVEHFNPALHWYERLGFTVINTGPIYFEMVWEPRGVRAASSPGSKSCQ